MKIIFNSRRQENNNHPGRTTYVKQARAGFLRFYEI
jgi:hypothetical protein